MSPSVTACGTERAELFSVIPNFEVLFGIPHHHRLVLFRSRSRGGVMRGTYWTHEEVDLSGTMVARYESYDEIGSTGQVQCGWCKYDSQGVLIGQQTCGRGWSVRDRTQPRRAA